MRQDEDIAEDLSNDRVALSAILGEVALEIDRLAEQCRTIQWSISTMLERVNHPDLRAEIHMLQDVDRIQQTLADAAAILAVVCANADEGSIRKADIFAAIRLESLRQRLGFSDPLPGDTPPETADVTWL